MNAHFVVAVMAVTTLGCKLKLEASLKAFEAGSGHAIVHVVTEPGAEIGCDQPMCSSGVPPSGEVDLKFSPPVGGKTTVVVKGKKGFKKGEVVVDVSGKDLPPRLKVDDRGSIHCLPRYCSGTIALAPSASISVSTDPGAVFQIGSDTFTAGPDGKISAPLSLALRPPLEQQPLAKICVSHTRYGAKNIITTIPVTMTIPSKGASSVKADLDIDVVEKNLAKFFAGVTTGPVLFPWEKPGTPAKGRRAAAFVYEDDCYDAGSPDATVADLDVVAIAENSKRVGQCTYHSPTRHEGRHGDDVRSERNGLRPHHREGPRDEDIRGAEGMSLELHSAEGRPRTRGHVVRRPRRRREVGRIVRPMIMMTKRSVFIP